MSFQVALLEQKLAGLSVTENSIQSLALWMIHHKRHAETQARVWSKWVKTADADKGVVLFYLANEVIQNSKRKANSSSSATASRLVAPEILGAFKAVLPACVQDFSQRAKESLVAKVNRIVKIWGERNVFTPDFIQSLRRAMEAKAKTTQKRKHAEVAEPGPSHTKRAAGGAGSMEGDMDVDPVDLAVVLNAIKDVQLKSMKQQDHAVRLDKILPGVFDAPELDACRDKKQLSDVQTAAENCLETLSSLAGVLEEEQSSRRTLIQMLERCLDDQQRRLVTIAEEREQNVQQAAKGKEFCSKATQREKTLPAPPPLPTLPKSTDLFGGMSPPIV